MRFHQVLTQEAEKLLGKGDMLYAPIGSTKPIRVQGAFISEEEITRIVDYIKRKDVSETSEMIEREIESSLNHNDDKKGGYTEDEEERDPILIEAIERCINDKTASISYLRRKFKIGDSRAGRIIDQMEKMGIISAAVGNKAREVLVTPYTWGQIKDKFVSGEASHITESRRFNRK